MKSSMIIENNTSYVPEAAFVSYRERGEGGGYGRSSHKTVLVGYKIKDGVICSTAPYPLDLRKCLDALEAVPDERLSWIPERVLAIGRDEVVWWRPPEKDRELSWRGEGGEVKLRRKIPGMVFMASDGSLHVWKVKGESRPTEDTMLYPAPFPQVTEGRVHLCGVSKTPQLLDIVGWENVFLESTWRCAKADWSAASRRSTKPAGKIREVLR